MAQVHDSPEHDLGRLLDGLDPRLDGERWMFAAVGAVPAGTRPLMTFREDEGLTVVLAEAEARRAGLDGPAFRRITLGVVSSLEAVGLTAAVATALAKAGISANVVAAYWHDHVFVPDGKAEAALAVLRRLAEG